MLENFAVFILSHGRPERVMTLHTLKRNGYTYPAYIIIDNEDKKADKYYEAFGDKVIIFDKEKISKTFDEADNFGDRRTVVYARNACFEIARKLNIKYFLQLDDDYYKFEYRINNKMEYPTGFRVVRNNLNKIFDIYLKYFQSIDAKSIAMSQGGDWYGGEKEHGKPKRKAMNSFFCSVDRPFKFYGRVNEDVNTYVWYQGLGNLFLTVPFASIGQFATQSNAGGMSEMYLDTGTYTKSFYTLMYSPSCVTIRVMGSHNRRLHHRITWNDAVPKIIKEKYKK